MAYGLPQSIMSIFKSFTKGGGACSPAAGELFELASRSFSTVVGVVAAAGGGQANATQLSAANSRIDTVVTAADSVVLPPAIQGANVSIWNNTSNACQVFGQPANQQTGVGDTIVASANNTVIASGTGISLAGGATCSFTCYASGTWKQSLSA